MSYTTIMAVWPGEKAEPHIELKNSWGSAIIIWNEFCKKYLGYKDGEFLCNQEKLWPRYTDKTIPKNHRTILAMTYDRCYVEKKNFKRAAEDISAFLKAFPAKEESVNHWPGIAELFETSDLPAIGFWMTSVADDPFAGVWDEEKEEYAPLDWETCFELYEKMDAIE